MSAHKTPKACDVAGCDKEAERSININRVKKTSLSLKSQDLRAVHLCKEHYKVLKKETKDDIPDWM